jgi:hypothetical protein
LAKDVAVRLRHVSWESFTIKESPTAVDLKELLLSLRRDRGRITPQSDQCHQIPRSREIALAIDNGIQKLIDEGFPPVTRKAPASSSSECSVRIGVNPSKGWGLSASFEFDVVGKFGASQEVVITIAPINHTNDQSNQSTQLTEVFRGPFDRAAIELAIAVAIVATLKERQDRAALSGSPA